MAEDYDWDDLLSPGTVVQQAPIPTSKTKRTLKTLRKLSARLCANSGYINLYGSKLVHEWYCLYWGDHNYDLYPNGIGEPPQWQVGEDRQEPDWWPWWMSDLDLESALDIRFGSGRVFEHGREWHEPWRQWALLNGVAPGQAFRVAHPEPDVHKSGWETVEYDIVYSSHVVEIQPVSSNVVRKRWEHDLRKTSVYRALHVKLAKENARRIDNDVHALYIQQSLYQTRDDGSYSIPSGRALRLESSHRFFPCDRSCVGVEGRDDKGDFDTCMERLIEKACAANPRLSPDLIRSLEIRR